MNVNVSNRLSSRNRVMDQTLQRKQNLLDKKREELETNKGQGQLQAIADRIRMDKEQNKLNAQMEQIEKRTRIEQGKKQIEQEKERLESMADPKMAEFMLRMEMATKNVTAAATTGEMSNEAAELDVSMAASEEMQIQDKMTTELHQEGTLKNSLEVAVADSIEEQEAARE